MTLRVDADPGVVGGVQGALRYDAARLRYIGQAPEGNAITMVNDREAESGRLRLASFHVPAVAASMDGSLTSCSRCEAAAMQAPFGTSMK